MTDNEIIKALECCINDDCEDCPLYGENAPDVYGNCVQNTKRNALDLINRQKAEIERLQKIIVGFMDEVGTWSNKYDVDTSNINKLPILAKEDYNIKNKIKSEAIKEFAEKAETELDERVSEKIRERNPHWYLAKRILRETAIEMTEQKNERKE